MLTNVTNSQLFNFYQEMIDEFRIQLGKLIDNLSAVYRLPNTEGCLEILTVDLEDISSVILTQPSQQDETSEVLTVAAVAATVPTICGTKKKYSACCKKN